MPMRLAQIDVPTLARGVPPVASQIAFGLACALASIALRALLDMFLFGAGPFALAVPFVLIATLFGRLLAGLVCQTTAGLYAWYVVLPEHNSFAFVTESDGPRVAVNFLAGYFTVALADVFRRAVRQSMRDRETLLYELEHRVKNSFASIVAVLRMQAASADDAALKEAMQSAIRRVNSYALAYGFLSHQVDRVGKTNLAVFLQRLCNTLASAIPDEARIRFISRADSVEVTRDQAITIGLLINEITTNSLKHAFREQGGAIRVDYRVSEDHHILTVADDGRGIDENPRKGALGLRLVDALTQQMHATYDVESSSAGTVFTFKIPI